MDMNEICKHTIEQTRHKYRSPPPNLWTSHDRSIPLGLTTLGDAADGDDDDDAIDDAAAPLRSNVEKRGRRRGVDVETTSLREGRVVDGAKEATECSRRRVPIGCRRIVHVV